MTNLDAVLRERINGGFGLGGQGSVLAQADSDEQKGQRIEIEDVLVIGKRDDVLLVAGSERFLIKSSSTKRTT